MTLVRKEEVNDWTILTIQVGTDTVTVMVDPRSPFDCKSKVIERIEKAFQTSKD